MRGRRLGLRRGLHFFLIVLSPTQFTHAGVLLLSPPAGTPPGSRTLATPASCPWAIDRGPRSFARGRRTPASPTTKRAAAARRTPALGNAARPPGRAVSAFFLDGCGLVGHVSRASRADSDTSNGAPRGRRGRKLLASMFFVFSPSLSHRPPTQAAACRPRPAGHRPAHSPGTSPPGRACVLLLPSRLPRRRRRRPVLLLLPLLLLPAPPAPPPPAGSAPGGRRGGHRRPRPDHPQGRRPAARRGRGWGWREGRRWWRWWRWRRRWGRRGQVGRHLGVGPAR